MSDVSGPRLFEFHDGGSDKFWIIELAGSSHTVRYGRQGTDGQTKTKDFASPDEAQKSYDKLIAAKVKKGYVEATTTGESRGEQLKATEADLKAQEPFLQEIRENPDDPGVYAVFADWLEEQGNPRGEFMNVQLRLEDESVKAADRKNLKKQETALLKQHAREWLGDLAPYLIDQKGKDSLEYHDVPVFSYQFARGLLDSLTVHFMLPDFAKVLRRSPHASTLRRLHLEHVPNGDELVDEFAEYSEQDWHYDSNPCFDALAGCLFDNIRHFEISDNGQSNTMGSGVEKLIRRMPLLETLHLESGRVDTEKIFKLPMSQLRSLTVHHVERYPLDVLAKNKSLGQLESIWFFPHALHYGEEPYLNLDGLKAVCRSNNLKSLKHLALYSAALGDEGLKELIESGLLSRLETLDLSYGCITDVGAELVANSDLSHLKKLTFDANYLTKTLVNKLNKCQVNFSARDQYTGDPEDPSEHPEYLFAGDWE